MLSCHRHSQEQMQVLWEARNKCLLNAYYEDTFPDGLDVKDLPAVWETWARSLEWGEFHGQRSRRTLCAGVPVTFMVDLGHCVLIILSSGLHTAPSAQALASLRAHFCMNHNHHLCSRCL